jgi:lipopolysaccharide export system protein LptA
MTPKTTIPNKFVIAVLLLVVTAISLNAAERFQFKSDSSKMIKPRGKKEIILTGNASIESETLVITADKIRRFGSDLQYTECFGNVKAVDRDRDIEITSDHLFFDTDSDTMTIESWSELYDKGNDVVTKSGYLYDQRKDKITFLSINVRIFRDEVVCRSEFATFDHNTEMLELTGNPVIYKDGNEMTAFRIYYDINTEEVELIGNVSGTIETDDEETDNTETEDTKKEDTGKDTGQNETEQEQGTDSNSPGITKPETEQENTADETE